MEAEDFDIFIVNPDFSRWPVGENLGLGYFYNHELQVETGRNPAILQGGSYGGNYSLVHEMTLKWP